MMKARSYIALFSALMLAVGAAGLFACASKAERQAMKSDAPATSLPRSKRQDVGKTSAKKDTAGNKDKAPGTAAELREQRVEVAEEQQREEDLRKYFDEAPPPAAAPAAAAPAAPASDPKPEPAEALDFATSETAAGGDDDGSFDEFRGEGGEIAVPTPADDAGGQTRAAEPPVAVHQGRAAPTKRPAVSQPKPKPKSPPRRGARGSKKEAKKRERARQLQSAELEGLYDGEDRVEAEKDALDDIAVLDQRPFPDMKFQDFGVNPTVETRAEAFSTFAIDVDTASYTITRGYLERGALPPREAVRVEEFVNAFDYGYRPPEPAESNDAFSIQAEAFPSPNRRGYHVLHLGLKGREVDAASRKAANLIFVIDVSGSMNRGDRLGLVKAALRLLVDQLDERDTVGIAVYGDDARVVLPPTSATQRQAILAGIDRLKAEGSTNAAAGLRLGYQMAAQRLDPQGINRVVLCSDGVANTGLTDADDIFATVKREAARGVTISTVGFGMGNYNDVLLERLADIGNGNYHYVDRLGAARRVFVERLAGTLQVIAKDVKIQVEFDPRRVARYRLLGYENRALSKRDFDDDRVDAGEIGAGHTVTAIYEVKLRRSRAPLGKLRVRYKSPRGVRSRLIEKALPSAIVRAGFKRAAPPTRLSLAVSAFAEKLRGSYWVRNLEYADVLKLIDGLPGALRRRGEVAELRRLVKRASELDRRPDPFEELVPIAQMDFDQVPVLR